MYYSVLFSWIEERSCCVFSDRRIRPVYTQPVYHHRNCSVTTSVVEKSQLAWGGDTCDCIPDPLDPEGQYFSPATGLRNREWGGAFETQHSQHQMGDNKEKPSEFMKDDLRLARVGVPSDLHKECGAPSGDSQFNLQAEATPIQVTSRCD
ncbi:hypothetical protein N1851_002347 [Merluccius polli]|uniref:Uncharacterized protein n=1 Tax=Merluccius polli TaxID=89951 RepID=A0AA47NA95_MERPO|nr:hypothetical protein N1851_002347 [Merluccius polli]